MRTTPMFYIPESWFSPISFYFALPFAPTGSFLIFFYFLFLFFFKTKKKKKKHEIMIGSVSIAFWLFVCREFWASCFNLLPQKKKI